MRSLADRLQFGPPYLRDLRNRPGHETQHLEHGVVTEGYDPAVFRKGICGCWMKFDEHALESDYGWEIDHLLPRSMRGMSYLANLQPLL